MLYLLDDDKHRAAFIDRVREMLESGRAVELTEKKPPRSNQQNRYLHAILQGFAVAFGYTLDEVKDGIFKRICNPDIFVVMQRGRVMLKSTKDLDTAELTQAIERFRNWSMIKAGLYLPAPDEGGLILKMEAEAQRALEYVPQTTTGENG